MGNNENRMDNSSWNIAVSEKGRFNCLDESKVLTKVFENADSLLTGCRSFRVRIKFSQVCNLKFEVVFLLLDFILLYVIHDHKLNFLPEENSL